MAANIPLNPENRIANVRSYLAAIGHPIGQVQAQEVMARAYGFKNKHVYAAAQTRVTKEPSRNPAMTVKDVMLQDVVGDYEVPEQVPEWAWIETHASFAHVDNGADGIWDYMVSLAKTFTDVPPRLQPVMEQAKQEGFSYILFNQGT